MKCESLDDFLDKVKSIGKYSTLYIWGTGIYGNLLGRLLDEEGVEWAGYYDNFASLSQLNSKRVFEGSQISSSEKAAYILTMRDYTGVRKQLLALGIEESNIMFFDNVNILTKIADIMVESSVSTDKIKSLYNMHLDESCFVIGNGPSLCIEDINKIYKSGKVSFASNMIYKCYCQTQWRPDYYFFIDVDGIRDFFGDNETFKYAAENCKYVFGRTSGDLVKYVDAVPNLILFRSILSSSEQQFDFSTDCVKQLYGGYTVTYAILQMAVYMGFKEIYLIGIDHNYSVEIVDDTVVLNEEIRDHSDLVGGYQSRKACSSKATKAYEAAKKYADEHGIKIYNATRGGKLEVFERVDFDSLFEQNVFSG